MADTILQIKHLEKSFGKNLVLKDISFDVSKGEVISIIGSSGSGKSTMLRCINLLEKTYRAEIYFSTGKVYSKTHFHFLNTALKQVWFFSSLIFLII